MVYHHLVNCTYIPVPDVYSTKIILLAIVDLRTHEYSQDHSRPLSAEPAIPVAVTDFNCIHPVNIQKQHTLHVRMLAHKRNFQFTVGSSQHHGFEDAKYKTFASSKP